jgi:hypothetical protein
MHRILVSFAALAVFSSFALTDRAEAMMPASASAVGAVQADAALVQRATVVCSNGGCAPVQTKRIQHKKPVTNIR